MKILTIILGGGKGTRLYPLTKERAKPAVPFGAKYRLVDIPISNSINAGFKNIYVLTQFNSASLHLHLARTYIFDSFSKGFVEILAAEQSFDDTGWYEGTADAVRKNLHHFRNQRPDYLLILSGDQLYRMDLSDFLKEHIANNAEVTVAATPVTRSDASDFGILNVNSKKRIKTFIEKPAPDMDIQDVKIPEKLHPDPRMLSEGREYLGSMGIYLFNADTLYTALDNNYTDFGHEVIPALIKKHNVQSYIYTGFWEDIGTIQNFYETSLELAHINPVFNFYDEENPIYTHRRDLPASKFNFSSVSQTLAADGCVITNAHIANSIVGIRTFIESGASLDGVICMGADYYETNENKEENRQKGIPNIGIGGGSIIKNTIVDRNTRIGKHCRIGIDDHPREEGDHGLYWMKDGIIIIPKNCIIPDGTII
ncbi:MAG: glucose-1-phosphate adenylyltransferase [Salinispira sp.]